MGRSGRVDDRRLTIVDVLQRHAREQGDKLAFRFLVSGDVDGPVETISYAQLEERARAVGARLQAEGVAGERALLLCPPGLDFVVAFFGCLFAGAVAVPAYPPDPTRLQKTLPLLRGIVADARPVAVLTTRRWEGRLRAMLPQAPELSGVMPVACDGLEGARGTVWKRPDISGETLAFLQFTSGSTSAPRGVMVSHGNILHNQRQIRAAFEHDGDLTGVSWLPQYHDMGLIGMVIQPIYVGGTSTLLSPFAFLRRPLRWLEAISRFRANTSGAPDFAYALCARKATDEDLARLDLSNWSLVFSGAEPVRRETLDRFHAVFAPCGLRREALYPCYGLAEATLLVTGGKKGQTPTVFTASAAALSGAGVAVPSGVDDASAAALSGAGVAVPSGSGGDGRPLVSCGTPRLGQAVVIVDPQQRVRCAPGKVGEIWVSGGSVAMGYWNRPEETAEAFRATLADTGEGPFLRTGDLGFLRKGNLYITGRLKELLVFRGQNHYPQDLERTVEKSDPRVRPGCCAAFSIDANGEDRLVVAVEVAAGEEALGPHETGEIADAIRAEVSRRHALSAYGVVLLKPHTIPKTTSGKIQRHACREAYLANLLEVVAISQPARKLRRPLRDVCDVCVCCPDTPATPSADGQTPTGEGRVDGLAEAPGSMPFPLTPLVDAGESAPKRLMERYVARQVAQVLALDAAAVDCSAPLATLGLDSLMGAELEARLAEALDLPARGNLLSGDLTVFEIAAQLLEVWLDARLADRLVVRGSPGESSFTRRSHDNQLEVITI